MISPRPPQPGAAARGVEAEQARRLAALGGEAAADGLGERTAVLVLDEPTTGLHPTDVDGQLALLNRLVDAGNTVIAVEHDLDLVRHADWIIDLGPDAGRRGGRIMFEGTPEQLCSTQDSHTAEHLRRAAAD